MALQIVYIAISIALGIYAAKDLIEELREVDGGEDVAFWVVILIVIFPIGELFSPDASIGRIELGIAYLNISITIMMLLSWFLSNRKKTCFRIVGAILIFAIVVGASLFLNYFPTSAPGFNLVFLVVNGAFALVKVIARCKKG